MRQNEPHGALTALIVATAAITGGLHLIGGAPVFQIQWSDPIGWLNTASVDQAVAAPLRLIGITTGYWVLGTTALYALTSRTTTQVPRWIRIVTMPGVRRVVDRTLATALAASIAATPFTPAVAEEVPPPPVIFDITTDGIPVPHIRFSDSPQPELVGAPNGEVAETSPVSPTLVVRAPVVARAPGTPATTAAATIDAVTSATHTVAPGDNLWLIAAGHLQVSVTEPTTAEVTRYWRHVIEANRSTLRSGDPNLIYPGEIVALPKLEVAS